MAELTMLESKLGEVLGLAMAAQDTGAKVRKLAEKEQAAARLVRKLDRMAKQAAETEERCLEIAERMKGKTPAILKKARKVKADAEKMMASYLGRDADALDGFEFLTMAEASEFGHWAVVRVLAKKARNAEVRKLAEWAIPIQRKHLDTALRGSVKLAGWEDPKAGLK